MGAQGFFLLFCSGLFVTGISAFAIFRKRKGLLGDFYLLFAAGSFFAGLASFLMIGSDFRLAWGFPVSGALSFEFQTGSLSGFFALALSFLAFSVSVYSCGYAREARNPAFQGAFYGLFLASIYAVFFASNIFSFLVSWEAMSLISYFLVTSDIEDEKAQRAGFTYATMTHVGTALIVASFMLAYSATGSMDFEGIRAGLIGKPAGLRSAIFLLSFFGFGIKAGIVPLHIWLPRAHPAAPSNISALMSGIMIKTGIYGIVRIGVDVLGGNVIWWGVLVLVVGALSSVLGVLYALMEHDLKRLLAYHSVENIGIILLGVGAGMIFYSNGQTALAGLALAAGLYHTMNHALFKGLLFIGAGSVLHSVKTKDMEKMGGLLKRMPWTGFFFLIGSVSICALPPFNGFVSEWLTFQALILGSWTPAVYTKVLSLLAGAALALTGALAAACFIKVFGISFLGLPRDAAAAEAKESPLSMVFGMSALGFLCLLLGIFPSLVIELIADIPVGGLRSVDSISSGSFLKLQNFSKVQNFSSVSPWAILILGLCVILPLIVLFRKVLKGAAIEYRDSWDCGIRKLTPRMQYTATAFTKPLRVIFKKIYLPKKEVKLSYLLKPLFMREIIYESHITPFFEKYAYEPFLIAVHSAARRIRKLQSGSLQLYLGYILITLIALLVVWGT